MTRPARLLALVLVAAPLAGAPFAGGAARAQAAADAPAEAGGAALGAAERAALGIETDAGAALYAQGRADALAFRLDDARRAFRRLGELEPRSTAGAYGLESAALWASLAAEDDAALDRFYVLNDSLADLADRASTPAGRLAAATARLHRAIAMGRQERYARAGLAFRDACGRFRDLDAAVGPDADFGRGVCEVAAGAIPRQYRFLARLLGFSGSVAGGLERLDAAGRGGGALAAESVIGLAISDATLNERRGGGVARVEALADAHPDSPLVAYLEGYLLLLDRRAEDAEAAFRRARAALDAPGVTDIPLVDANLGVALFRQDRFDEARELLEAFVRTYRGPSLVAQSTLMAGIAAEMSGDRRGAEALYRRVRARRDYDSDVSAEREAERRLEAPMTASERALLLGQNAFDAGRYEDAVRVLQPIVTGADLPALDRAEAAYRTGRAYQATEQWADALRHFKLAIDNPGDPLAKWGPWALYHTGEVYEAEGQTAEAREAYEGVLDNETEFDYHKSLEQRTRAALERLGR
ncbi:tetratricopeptide repeat protein [Rubrivirga litoralis]|uniref:Tetratricopeptide repeat protein n=1 Tax=Rubrivirga litoralis TaxID=3075598 RepID=A0ABU3BMG7_9BACT|nr:tetratricopeptide repeat protein [Rubrivirga sp. F394]MDT0630492.1 tetratricopeptide repeat protein [Rubrivirga sp. F394]